MNVVRQVATGYFQEIGLWLFLCKVGGEGSKEGFV